MGEIASFREGAKREIIGPAARIERLKPQINRIGASADSGMESSCAPSRRKQFDILHRD